MTTNPSNVMHSRRGFSLTEIVCALVVMGIMAAVAGPMLLNAVPMGQDRNAGSLAQCINAAELNYSLRVSNATTLWSSASNDAARYLLIQSRIPYAPSTFSAYVPTGYTFVLGPVLATQVQVTGPRGTLSY